MGHHDWWTIILVHFDSLIMLLQTRHNSSALAMALHVFCMKPIFFLSALVILIMPICCFPLRPAASSHSLTVPLVVVSSLALVAVVIAVIVGAVVVRRKKRGRETFLCCYAPACTCQRHYVKTSKLRVTVRGIHRGPMNSPHKWPVTRKMFPFDDVIMQLINLVYP